MRSKNKNATSELCSPPPPPAKQSQFSRENAPVSKLPLFFQVRVNQTKDIDHLKSTLTGELQPPMGPIRKIYTPAGGTEVTSVSSLTNWVRAMVKLFAQLAHDHKVLGLIISCSQQFFFQLNLNLLVLFLSC